MIDWANLAANSLWILGCTLALATLSYASWEASVYKDKFTARLKKPAIQISLNLAGILFCAGLAATSSKTYEIILWSVLALLFLLQVAAGFAQSRKDGKTGSPQ